MATIVSSIIAEDSAQADGRRRVTEVHTDSVGLEHHQQYLAESGDDADAHLALTAIRLDASLADRTVRDREATDYDTALVKVQTFLDGTDLQAEAGLTADENTICTRRGI